MPIAEKVEINECSHLDALHKAEKRSLHLFETTPVSLWEEDFSAVKQIIDRDFSHLSKDAFNQYLETNPEFVNSCVTKVKIIDINQATLKLFGAKNKAELLGNLTQVFTPESYEAFKLEMIAIHQSKTLLEIETSNRTLSGESRSTSLRWIVPPEYKHCYSRVFVSIVDNTERKEAREQLRQHRRQLAHFSRISTAGEMVSSIAHQLNQPLSGMVQFIGGCIERLKNENVSNDIIEAMNYVASEAERAGDIIHRLNNFLRKGELQKTFCNIKDLVKEATKLMSQEITDANVKLQLKFKEKIPSIWIDKIQIEQVIVNIAHNAIEVMHYHNHNGKPRKLTIETTVLKNAAIQIIISDTGPGISAERLKKVFEPFYTTKEQGMGMGLSLCHSIITAHGGDISVESEVGKGCRFYLTLPMTDEG